MDTCLNEETIGRYVAGKCTSEEVETIEAHLLVCELCRQRVEDCRQDEAFLDDLKGMLARRPDSSDARETKPLSDITEEPHAGSPSPGISVFRSASAAVDIEGYRILREIHRGGQGVVYEAIQEATRRKVALKVMLGAAFSNDATKKRFEREVEVVANFSHENIVRIYDSGLTHGQYYFAMEYIEGQRLDAYISRKKPHIRELLELFRTICSAVAYAHQRLVIHRDLSPSNILVDEQGKPYVVDFGLAKQLEEEDRTQFSIDGQVMGKLAYMSPEQSAGKLSEVDVRTDVYALGVVLYEMLTGRYPYTAARQIADVLRNFAESEPEKPSSISPAVDDEIETIVLKALSKDKERRYQNVADLARDVERYLRHEPIEAKRDSVLYVLRKAFRRHRAAATASAAFLLTIAGSSVIALGLYARAKQAERQALTQRDAANQATTRAASAEHSARDELRRANIGRARLYAKAGNVAEANKLLWKEFLEAPEAPDGMWALIESYAANPCLATIEVPSGNEGKDAGISAVRFLPDSRHFVSGGMDGHIRLWDTQSQQCLRSWVAHKGEVKCIDISSDGKVLASCGNWGDPLVKLWRLPDGECLRSVSVREPDDDGRPLPTSLALASDGSCVFVGMNTGTVYILDAPSLRIKKRLTGNGESVLSMHFSRDGQKVAAGFRSPDGFLGGEFWVLEAPSGAKLLARKVQSGSVESICFSPDGKHLALSSKSIETWDLAAGRPKSYLPGVAPLESHLAYHPNGDYLISGDESGVLKVWDLEEKKLLKTLRGHSGPISSIDISLDGNSAVSGTKDVVHHIGPEQRFPVTIGWADGTVKLWDLVGAIVPRRIESPDSYFYARCFSPKRQLIALASGWHSQPEVWDIKSCQRIALLTGHDDSVHALAFSPDGSILASGSDDTCVRLWCSSSWECLATLKGHSQAVEKLLFSHNGHLLVSAGGGQIIVWCVDRRRALHRFAHPNGSLDYLAFSQDDSVLASGGKTVVVALWDMAGGRQIKEWKEDTYDTSTLAYTADPNYLITAYDQHMERDGPSHTIALCQIPSLTLSQQVEEPNYASSSGNRDRLIDVSHDGRRLAFVGFRLTTAAEAVIFVWDLVERRRLASIPARGMPEWVYFSADGELLVVGEQPVAGTGGGTWHTAEGFSVSVYSADGSRLLIDNSAFFPIPTVFSLEHPLVIAHGLDERYLLSLGNAKECILGNLPFFLRRTKTAHTMRSSDTEPAALLCGFVKHKPGDRMYWPVVTPSEGKKKKRLTSRNSTVSDEAAAPTPSGRQLRAFRSFTDPCLKKGVAFLASSMRLGGTATDGMWRMYSFEDGVVRFIESWRPKSQKLSCVDYGSDGRRMLVGTEEGIVWQYNMSERIGSLLFSMGVKVESVIACGPENALVRSKEHELSAYNLKTQRRLWSYTASLLNAFAVFPDGRHVVVVSHKEGARKESVHVLDANTGVERAKIAETGRYLIAVACSPDNRTIAVSCDGPDHVQLWNWTQGNLLRKLESDGFRIVALAFSPDGKLLASGSQGTARIWEVESGRPLGVLSFDDDCYVESVSFSADGRLLVGASSGGHVQIAEVPKTRE